MLCGPIGPDVTERDTVRVSGSALGRALEDLGAEPSEPRGGQRRVQAFRAGVNTLTGLPNKRTLVLLGQKTSVTIEPEFGHQLRLIAMEYQTSVTKLITEIDRIGRLLPPQAPGDTAFVL